MPLWIWLISLVPVIAWVGLLLVPWRPWSTREQLEPSQPPSTTSLSNVTVLIPARDEAEVIETTLRSLLAQNDRELRIIVIDDQSTDDTARIAKSIGGDQLTVLQGKPLPEGWAGKLWALEQGRKQARTELILLLDADISVDPGMLTALKDKLEREGRDMVSIMANLRMDTFWEKLLIPAFVYFFKLIYPFSLGNSPNSSMGVAAGGCILIRKDALVKAGAFESIRGAIIDDCTLAKKVKDSGHSTWIGLSHSVKSHRPYENLGTLWNMVARSAYTQLHYSVLLLLGTTLAMLLLYWGPVAGLALNDPALRSTSLTALLTMCVCYLPTLRYYRRSPFWALMLPVIATLYLLMTWTSAIRHYRGRTAQWKGRSYS